MIFNLRGTSGSGKGWVIEQWFKKFPGKPHFGTLGPRRPEAYRCDVPGVKAPVYVLGPYNTPCGGCDAIQPYDNVITLLNKYGDKGHVLFEGMIIAGAYGRVGEALEKWGKDVVLIFLTTTLDQCLENIRRRRQGRGDDRPLSEKNTRVKFKQIQLVLKRLRVKKDIGQEFKVLELASEDVLPTILEMLHAIQ
jgi:hypothetical protein